MHRIVIGLVLLVGVGACKLHLFGEILPRAEVSGRVVLASGVPVADAHVLVELRPMIPDGQPNAGACRPEVVGGGGTRTDARGHYRVGSDVRLSWPLAACVTVHAARPPASALGAPATTGPVLRWPSVESFASAVANVTLDSVPAP